ncbi:MAG: hypothetical protein IKU00_07520 [Bacteroidales bacterium]|nr:hypothetical protein [Bacteroidales bacterium]
MSVSFTLEKRTNLHDESPIRISWSFMGERFQSTLGISVKKEDWDEKSRLMKADTHNHSGKTADEVNFLIKRISVDVMDIELACIENGYILDKDMMKKAISDAMSNDIARPNDIVERCMNGITSEPEPTPHYYHCAGKYYQFICDADHILPAGGTFKILQELSDRHRRIAVPLDRFKKINDGISSSTPFEEVSKEEVFR